MKIDKKPTLLGNSSLEGLEETMNLPSKTSSDLSEPSQRIAIVLKIRHNIKNKMVPPTLFVDYSSIYYSHDDDSST